MRFTESCGKQVTEKHYSRRAAWKKRIASAGESQAARYLANQGYSIVAQNWRAGRQGEIDLIAADSHGILVFVEVKTRTIVREPECGIQLLGFEAINWRKQRKIVNSAQRFLQSTCYWPEVRFDAITVIYQLANLPSGIERLPEPSVIHVPGAF